MRGISQILSGGFMMISAGVLLLGYQNCGSGFQAVGSSALGSNGNVVNADSELRDALNPNIVSDCLVNPKYNACIFWKNPVAQRGSPLTQEIVTTSDLSSLQIHAVNITGFDTSGNLRNSFISVRATTDGGSLSSVNTRSGLFKFNYADNQHRLGQVMAFYWLNLQARYMKSFTGTFFVEGKSVDVITYDPDTVNNAYWNPLSEQIVMGATPGGNEFALSAEVYAHEMGHGNLSFASDFKIHEVLQSDKNQTCGGGSGVCCTTINGCSWAINEGQADYHAGILFPNNTAFLETFSNSVTGITECGIGRSMDANRNLSAQQAFSACSGNEGEVHVTGRIYAGLWWEVRDQAEKQFPGVGASEIDTIFTEHLPGLNGDDDFLSAKDKILATDLSLFSGKYSQFFADEFARRGILE